jgi:hypothetical protein
LSSASEDHNQDQSAGLSNRGYSKEKILAEQERTMAGENTRNPENA